MLKCLDHLHPSTLQESLKTNNAGQSVINQRRQQKKAQGCQNMTLLHPQASEQQSSRTTILPDDSGVDMFLASIVWMGARISTFLIPMRPFEGRIYQYLHSSSLIWGLVDGFCFFFNVRLRERSRLSELLAFS